MEDWEMVFSKSSLYLEGSGNWLKPIYWKLEKTPNASQHKCPLIIGDVTPPYAYRPWASHAGTLRCLLLKERSVFRGFSENAALRYVPRTPGLCWRWALTSVCSQSCGEQHVYKKTYTCTSLRSRKPTAEWDVIQKFGERLIKKVWQQDTWPFTPWKDSPSPRPHLSHRSRHFLKWFWTSSPASAFSCPAVAASMSWIDSKPWPFLVMLTLGRSQKSPGARPGE